MDKNKPLISIIIPNYNHSQFLRQRIDSVLNQTYQNIELIILDDCSTDNSRDIIKSYSSSEKVSHIIFNEDNSGSPFLQWQKGFLLAEGKYIWIAESDDYADLTFLEKLVPLLENNPNSNVAFCCSHSVDEKGNVLSQDWDRNKEQERAVNVFEGKAFVRARMLFNNNIYNASMTVFRKTVLDKISNQYAEYKYCGDWFFWNKVCMQGDVVRYCEKLNYFRQHSQKATPKAQSEGVIFEEGKYVIEDMAKGLGLTSLQRTVIVGRFLKRIVASDQFKSKEVKKNVLKDSKNFFKLGSLSIFVYGLDKIFNFSSLNIRKNKYL